MITDQEFNKGLLTLQVKWFAMLMSLAIYLFVGLQVATKLQVSMNDDTFAILKTVLYIVAFVTVIFARYIRKFFLSAKGQFKQPIRIAQHPALQKYSTAMIVALAMSESIGIYGLVLFILGKNTMDLYLLLLLAAAAMFMYRPRKDELIKLSKESQEDSITGGESEIGVGPR